MGLVPVGGMARFGEDVAGVQVYIAWAVRSCLCAGMVGLEFSRFAGEGGASTHECVTPVDRSTGRERNAEWCLANTKTQDLNEMVVVLEASCVPFHPSKYVYSKPNSTPIPTAGQSPPPQNPGLQEYTNK